ncbi:hypothetical protein ACOMHN_033305 [Nucella lapillus]
MRFKRKRLLIDIVQLICGYVVGWTLVQQRHRLAGLSPCSRSAGEAAFSRGDSLTVTDNTLMIGIMTSRKNLDTRTRAIYSTWGREVSGLLVFYIGHDDPPEFSSDPSRPTVGDGKDLLKDDPRQTTGPPAQAGRDESVKESPTASGVPPAESAQPEPIQIINDLPVVQLRDVSDDTYPPRGKCFAMLRHMFRHFGSRFQWFMRADDDMYLRYEELVKYLHSLDTSAPRYVGQPGIGIPTERGLLGLNPGNPYCMGGPGVVFSPLALSLLVPHLEECERETVTSHEDTELGRCVLQHVKVACTNTHEMKTLFYQDYTRNNFAGELVPDVTTALTLHPVKKSRAMFRLHVYFLQQKLHHLQSRVSLLETHIHHVNQMDAADPTMFSDTVSTQASNGQFTFNRQKSVRDFVARTTRVGKEVSATRSSIQNWLGEMLPDSLKRAEVLSQQRSSGDELRDDPKTIPAIVEDVLKTDNPVWMYANLGRPFMINPSEIHNSRIAIMNAATMTLKSFKKAYKLNDLKASRICAKYQSYTLPHGLQHVVTAAHGEGSQSFLLSSKFQPLQWRENLQQTSEDRETGGRDKAWKSDIPPKNNSLFDDHKLQSLYHGRDRAILWPPLYILVPLKERHQTYLTFLKNLALAAAKYPAPVNLRVALFPDGLNEHQLSLAASRGRTAYNVTIVRMLTPFSRAAALNKLSQDLAPSSILAFIDVDLILTHDFLFRVALTVKPGQAYFPVMFSQYSPSTVCYPRPNCSAVDFNFSSDSGLWRSFSFGMAGLTAADMRAVGGLDSGIVGWGKEDVVFFERCVSKGITIFRAPDVGLIHRYHDKSCDYRLPADQLRMCMGSRDTMIGSNSKLAQMLLDLDI